VVVKGNELGLRKYFRFLAEATFREEVGGYEALMVVEHLLCIPTYFGN